MANKIFLNALKRLNTALRNSRAIGQLRFDSWLTIQVPLIVSTYQIISAHTNNYLIKLIILLNKTSRLPGPADFPNIIRIIVEVLPCRFSANMKIFSSYICIVLDIIHWSLTNIILITARHGLNHVYVIHIHQTASEFGQGGYKSKDTALNAISEVDNLGDWAQ